jgi:hypothetical protein
MSPQSVTTLMFSLNLMTSGSPVTIPCQDAMGAIKASHAKNAIRAIISIGPTSNNLFLVVESVRMPFWDVRFAIVKISVRNAKYPTC